LPYTRGVSRTATLEDWEPQLPGSSWFSWLWLTIAFCVMHTILVVTGIKPFGLEISGLTKFFIGPIAIIVMVLLAQRKYQVGRASIQWMAVAIGVWWLGDLLQNALQAFVSANPNLEPVTGVPYLIAVLCMLRAVWQLPQVARLRQEMASIWYETLMMMTAALMAVWRFSISDQMSVQDWSGLEVGFEVLGPILCVGLLGFLLLAVMRQGDQVFLAYHWLVLGVLCFTVANLSRIDLTASYSTTASDLFGMWGMVFWLASALTGTQPRVEQNPLITRFVSMALTSLPYLSVLATYLITLTYIVGVDHEKDEMHQVTSLVLLIGVGIVTALVIVRQFLMILENRHLNETLELRVAERGQQLEVSQARLNASERLASLGQLTAGLAHEVNTPLASAMNSVMQAEGLALEYEESIGASGVTDDDHRQIAQELRGSLGIVKGTLNRLGELIRKMRAQGRNPNEGAVRFNPIKMAQDALVMLEHPALQAKVELLLEIGPQSGAEGETLFVHGDPVRFVQIVTNLTQNAIHACEDGRKTDGSRVRLFFTHDANHVMMHVSDNGSGIPEKVLPQIFDPLFTTKADGRGTGLGLSIIKDIVTSHFSGRIDCDTKAGKGTTFNVTMNRVHESTPMVIPAAQALEASSH
jgi:signal transduction histidine kinase